MKIKNTAKILILLVTGVVLASLSEMPIGRALGGLENNQIPAIIERYVWVASAVQFVLVACGVMRFLMWLFEVE